MSKKNRRGRSRLLDEQDLLSAGGGGSGEVSDDDKFGGGMKVKKSRRAKGKGKENLTGSGSGKTSGVTTPQLKEDVEDDSAAAVEGLETTEEPAIAPIKGKKLIEVEAVLEEEMSKKDKRRLKELGREMSSKNSSGPVDELVRFPFPLSLLLLSTILTDHSFYLRYDAHWGNRDVTSVQPRTLPDRNCSTISKRLVMH